ncbi:hypothetical protein JT359_10265, partial [Candidatus Poribacteria bacterium]|nr:hypothetical protein [Candidatus Poribacteria bacterium]
DRSGFEKLAYSDIEKGASIFDVVFPDVLLSEIFNPSASNRKKALEQKLLKFDRIYLFTHNDGASIISHNGIFKNIISGKFPHAYFASIKPQEVLESVNFKWLREYMDSKNRNLNQRGYHYHLDGSDEGKSFNDLIDMLADNNSMDDVEKKGFKKFFKRLAVPGSSQEPEDIAKSVDILILINKFGQNTETYEDLEKIIEMEVPYNSLNDRNKYLLFYDWMIYYLTIGESVPMKGLDKSYFNDMMYCYYMPFCDVFVADDKIFPSILKPVCDRFDFINFMTFNEFKDRFLQ